MDRKVALLICVCVCALAITFTEAGIPKCCISTIQQIPKRVLRKVYRWEVQQSSGACDISALILHIRNHKPICAHPKLKMNLISLQQKMRRNKLKAMY